MSWLGAALTLLGLASSIIGGIVAFLVRSNHRNADRIHEVERKLASVEADLPKTYADHTDTARLEREITGLRQDLNALGAEVRGALVNVAEKLNQLIGQMSARG